MINEVKTTNWLNSIKKLFFSFIFLIIMKGKEGQILGHIEVTRPKEG